MRKYELVAAEGHKAKNTQHKMDDTSSPKRNEEICAKNIWNTAHLVHKQADLWVEGGYGGKYFGQNSLFLPPPFP